MMILTILCIAALLTMGCQMRENIDDLKKEMDGIRKENEEFKADLNSLTRLLVIMEVEIAGLKEQDQELKGKMGEMKKNIDEVRLTITSFSLLNLREKKCNFTNFSCTF